MGRYNLLDEAWIPVLRKDTGAVESVSLFTLFTKAHNYSALAGEMATQNFAMLRVLLAVLVTVFTRVDQNGEGYEGLDFDETAGDKLIVNVQVDKEKLQVDEEDADEYLDALDETWQAIWQAHQIPVVVIKYLQAWHDRFYLLDDEYPFFQVTKADLEARLPAGKCATALNAKSFAGKQINRRISESNNKGALFAPVVGDAKDKMSEAELTRWLITMQGYVGTADKGKFPTAEKVTNSKGWLYDIGGIYMAGDDLFETLWLNTILHHPADEQYSLAKQVPCWEEKPAARLEAIIDGKPLNNLAALYTAWSRAVYIPPDWTAAKKVSLGAIKVTEIAHENAFLETMTLWRFNETGDHKNKFTPCTHQPAQSLWRSFGLLIPAKQDGDKTKQPGILTYYQQIAPHLDNRMVKLQAVSMLSDENATSWLPKDEVKDTLSLNEIILTDEAGDGWSVRVRNIVEETKNVIETYYRTAFLLKGIGNFRFGEKDKNRMVFVNKNVSLLYERIDNPFREWLGGIRPEDDKSAKDHLWKAELYAIILDEAARIMSHLSLRDYKGKDDGKENCITVYQKLKRNLSKKLKSN